MKAKFNYKYNGQAISKSQFENNVEDDWKEMLSDDFSYSYGYYSATLIDDEVVVDVKSFEIYEYMGGYFSIKGMFFNQEIEVLGGDSANEDDYNREFFEDVLNRWEGKLMVEQDRLIIDTDSLPLF